MKDLQKMPLSYNTDWQIRAKIVWAQILIVLAPRGTGKTEEILGTRTLDCVEAMPGGKGALIAVSYKKMMSQLLPPLVSSWKKDGYIRGVDFFIGNEPRPKKYLIDSPDIDPIQKEHCIQFTNGHLIHLGSQDRPGMLNGLSVDWLGVDEARLLNKERYDEDASAILRGNELKFGHLPQHGSITMVTDMPFTDEGLWLFDMETHMDRDVIEWIYQTAMIREAILDEIEDLEKEEPLRTSKLKTLQREADKLEKILNEARRGFDNPEKPLVHYMEVSDGSNLLFLGERFVYNQMKVMQANRFATSILGIRSVRGYDDFYPAFNASKHGYYNSNHDYLQALDLSQEGATVDCRTDGDINDSPIYFACDHNTAINWAVFGQFHGNEFKILKSMYVLNREGKKLSDLLSDIVDYYWPIKSKSWIYIYDATSTKTTAKTNETEADEVMSTLRSKGFIITPHFIGQPYLHEFKFKEFRKIYSNEHKIKVSINRDNNEQLIKIIETTKAIVVGDKTQKDKSREKKIKDFPQEDAPHGTDAKDLLVLGAINRKFNSMIW